jgi:hypothetical protein
LQNIVASIEIHIPGLNSSVISDGRICSIGWNVRDIVAQSIIKRQPRSGFPGILKKDTQNTAWARVDVLPIVTIRIIRDIQDEGCDRVTGILGVRGVGISRLLGRESNTGALAASLESVADVPCTPFKFVGSRN